MHQVQKLYNWDEWLGQSSTHCGGRLTESQDRKSERPHRVQLDMNAYADHLAFTNAPQARRTTTTVSLAPLEALRGLLGEVQLATQLSGEMKAGLRLLLGRQTSATEQTIT